LPVRRIVEVIMCSTRPFHRLAILTAVVVASACTSISYDRDDSIRIPAGATVAFGGGSSEGRENLDPAVANDIVHRRMQTALVAQLEAKGYKLVDDPQTADFLVRYFVGVQRGTRQVATTSGVGRSPSWGPGWGPGWGWGWGSTVTTVTPVDFTDVSFAVDLVERSTGHTAWRGIWRGDPGTRAPTQQEIDDKMARILRSAPAAG
jgi:hypothetical protein